MSVFQQMVRQVYNADTYSLTGKIENIVGMSIEASGAHAAVGDICRIYSGDSGGQVTAEVVGFKNDHILLMPYSDMAGISAGNFVRNTGAQLTLRVGEFLRGRIINALGQPIDGKAPFEGGTPYCVGGSHINPLQRPPIRERIQFGIKAIDGMNTIGKGQRIGIFAGTGVGKSTLMGMIAKNVTADINVIALVGERGREVLEFVQKDLGEEGMKRSEYVLGGHAPLHIGGGHLRPARHAADEMPQRGHGHRGILPGPGVRRAADDGLPDPVRYGAAGNRSGDWRAAGGPGVHPLHVRGVRQAPGAKRQFR